MRVGVLKVDNKENLYTYMSTYDLYTYDPSTWAGLKALINEAFHITAIRGSHTI